MKPELYKYPAYFSLLCLVLAYCGCGWVPRRALELPPQPLRVDVVYPRLEEGDSIFVVSASWRIDSTFAIGSVQPKTAEVFVNGAPARVWENGAFMAYFPLDTLTMQYNFMAVAPDGDSARVTLPFSFPSLPDTVLHYLINDSVNSQLPARITISQDHAVLYTAPRQAYWLFPPSGTVAWADSFAYPYFRVHLCQGLHAWVEDRFVTLDTCPGREGFASRADPPRSVVNSIKVKGEYPWTQIRIPLQEPILFRLEERPEAAVLALDLYGAVARMDQINYDSLDSLVREIRWSQLRDDLLRLEIHLNSVRLWGYGAHREGNNLVIEVRWPPRLERRVLKGRVIALDAGHGGTELGAIGPTRLPEKEPNLKLTLRLKTLLEKEGANVVLTRWSDSTVGLYDRINYAAARGAEILISLHNNALLDGENPFVKRGTSVYYYHSQSRDLAWVLHEHLLDATGLRDHGFYYKNLALARPTEMLAVLLECAFMIHPEEEMLLRDDRFLDRIARSLVKGLKDYFRIPKKRTRFDDWSDRFRFGGVVRPPWYRIEPVRQHE